MSDHDIAADEIIIPPAPTTTTEYCDPETDQKQSKQQLIVDMLDYGPENATTRKELARRLNVKERAVTNRVHQERVMGFCICSSPHEKGYYLPSGPQDTREFIATMTSRARNTFAAITSAKRYHREHWGDINAPDEVGDSSPELDDEDEEVEND